MHVILYSLLAIRGGVATAATERACVSRAIQKTRRARTTVALLQR